MHRPLVHSFFPFVKSDHLKGWSWMPLSEQTSVRSHLKDQLVLQRPCYGHLVYPELTFHFSMNWKTKITSNQASILTRPHGFSCQNCHAFHLMPALEIKVKQVNLTDWLLQQKCGSIKYNEIFHLYSPLENSDSWDRIWILFVPFFLLQYRYIHASGPCHMT